MRFHAKSRLRDKTPRGKQLVQALTEVGILLWQRNCRKCRGREAARTGRHPAYRYSSRAKCNMLFVQRGAGRPRSPANQRRIGFVVHRPVLLLRFAQNFESPSKGKSGCRNLRGCRTTRARLRRQDIRCGPRLPLWRASPCASNRRRDIDSRFRFVARDASGPRPAPGKTSRSLP